jgi:hypothetical protein
VISHSFDTFCEMIDGLPSKAVPKAVVLEQRMLEEDLVLGRTFPNKDTSLILGYCRFLEAAIHGRLVLPGVMPMERWALYGKTVERLAAAGELPCWEKQDFEAAFMTANFATAT